MSDIENKKNALHKLGITVIDGNSYNILLKYKDKRITYSTNSFILYNTDYLIEDACKLFNIDNNMDDNFLIKLEKKKKHLKQLNIKLVWFGDSFYFEKDKEMIEYDFDDYIDMETDLFISDVINKFKDIKKNNTSNLNIKNLPFKNSKDDIVIDIKQMKENIKNIMIEKGFLSLN